MSRACGFWISSLLSVSLAVTALHAQSATTASAPVPAPDSVAPGPDSVPEQGKKKGGLFGKAKKFVGDKTVQQVAKTVACTMVPGGQVVVGAIDAASSDDVGEAAAGAAGAAAGQTCMPGGMAGMGAGAGVPGGGAGVMPGVGGVAGAAGLGAAGLGAGALGGRMGASGAVMPGAMPADEMGYDGMSGMPSPDQIAACLGMTTEEYLDFTDPTRGGTRSPTKADMKKQRQAAGKMDMARYQSCMMQQYTANMAATSGTLANAQTPAPAAAPAGLAAEVAKGKAVVRDIRWVEGEAKVSEESIPAFTAAMSELAAAITAGATSYRADLYLDKSTPDDALATLGAARLQVVVGSLEASGAGTGVVTAGKMKKDKNPRLEIVRDTK